LGLGVTPVVLARGAIVTVPYRKPEETHRLKEAISPTEQARIQLTPADLQDEQAVQHLVDDMPRVDVLIIWLEVLRLVKPMSILLLIGNGTLG
jgi:NAD(P)-dependent dehydrogenase (short-subunit alcohol dehydrogenase family)